MSLLDLKDTLDGLTRASGVRRYGLVLRRDNGDILRRALDFELEGKKATEYDVKDTSGGAYQSN